MSAWKTMESAPNDDGDVLLFWWYYYPGDRGPTAGIKLCSWNKERRGWEDDEGNTYQPSLFSHWMRPEAPPIPPRPEGSKSFVFPSDIPAPPQSSESKETR